MHSTQDSSFKSFNKNILVTIVWLQCDKLIICIINSNTKNLDILFLGGCQNFRRISSNFIYLRVINMSMVYTHLILVSYCRFNFFFEDRLRNLWRTNFLLNKKLIDYKFGSKTKSSKHPKGCYISYIPLIMIRLL